MMREFTLETSRTVLKVTHINKEVDISCRLLKGKVMHEFQPLLLTVPDCILCAHFSSAKPSLYLQVFSPAYKETKEFCNLYF